MEKLITPRSWPTWRVAVEASCTAGTKSGLVHTPTRWDVASAICQRRGAVARGSLCRSWAVTQTSSSQGLLDYEGAAEVLGCSPRMVRKLVETRQLECVKVGRLVRLEPGAIARYIERHRRAAI